MDFSKTQNIFIVGIKGVAMTGLAIIFKKMGMNVTGADTAEEQITDQLLKKYGIPHSIGFDKFPANTHLVIYSAAHGGIDNPIVKQAKEKNTQTINQAVLLGYLMDQFKTKIAVTGTHGKTTTSALLSYTLSKLNVLPSYLIGAPSFTDFEGADYGKKDYFVIEADEYAVDPPKDKTVKFLHLRPTHVLVTNIDFDHPDVYSSLKDVQKAFGEFMSGRKIVACIDDENLMDVLSDFPSNSYTTFGFNENADIRINAVEVKEDHTEFEILNKNSSLGKFTIKLFGKKNISNTAGVIALLLQLGFTEDKIREAISGFSGVKRRFEELFHIRNTYLFDDYAHHPAEIEAIIDAARMRFPDYKIIVLFQSHTYSRTKALLPEFASSLAKADYAVVAPIFPSARENKEEFNVSPEDVKNEAKKAGFNHVDAAETFDDVLGKLKPLLGENQVIFTMGAGDIYSLGPDIIRLLKNTVKSS